MDNYFGNDRFIILTTARTGSNLLARSLNRATGITCHGEIMKKDFKQEGSSEKFFLNLAEQSGLPKSYLEQLQLNNPAEFLKLIFSPKQQGTIGFKLFYYHAQEDLRNQLWQVLQQHKEIKIIHLIRENLLDTYISLQYAHLTKQWILPTFAYKDKIDQIERYDQEMLSIKPQILLDFFENTSKKVRENKIRFAQHNYLEIYYENLDNQYNQELTKVFNFLEVSPFVKAQPTLKQRSKTNRERIKNYQELLNFFQNTEWLRFFSD
jgi:LPS sulfotransferase NodH